MQVVLQSFFFFRKLNTALIVLKSVTMMLSNLSQAVVMISSCSIDSSPRSTSEIIHFMANFDDFNDHLEEYLSTWVTASSSLGPSIFRLHEQILDH